MINWKLMYPNIIFQIFQIGFVKIHKLYHDPIIFTDTPLGIYPMKATPEQYTRVMNDMQARKQVRHNRDNHNER